MGTCVHNVRVSSFICVCLFVSVRVCVCVCVCVCVFTSAYVNSQ